MTERTENRVLESIILFFTLFGIDRLTKYWVTKYLILRPCDGINITRFLSFDVTMNRGIAWGMFHTQSNLGFILITSVIVAIIASLVWYAWKQLRQGKFAIEEMLILSGAMSNLYDRFVYSGVIDFIHFHIGSWSFPVFNLADVYIVIGVLWVLFLNREK